MSELLKTLLEKSQVFGCEYSEHLSSHLPMALIALDKIGAKDEQLLKFYSDYSVILETQIKSEITINSTNWKIYLGKHSHNSPYREYFLTELAKNGISKTLSTYLPQLIPGLSGGAFHPLIRLSYAVEINSIWESAESLASWCMAYQELGIIDNQSKHPPVKLLDSLKILSNLAKENLIAVHGENVFSYLNSVATNETFIKFFKNINLEQITLNEIAEATIRLYLSTQDSFTALHCVTATHAMRIVEPYLDGKEHLKYLWQSVCATYVITKLVTIIEKPDTGNLPSWEDIFQVARDHKNDHVIKFAYTAHCEFLKYRNSLYHLAAAKKSELR